MARSLEPVIDVDRAGFDARAVRDAYVKVDADVRAPDAQLAGGVRRPPDRDALVLADLLALALEPDVYRAVDLGIACACA